MTDQPVTGTRGRCTGSVLQMMGLLSTDGGEATASLRESSRSAWRERERQKADEITERLDAELQDTLQNLKTLSGGQTYYVLYTKVLDTRTVDDVYDELRTIRDDCDGRFNVILFSSGGYSEAAFNLACLFRSIGHESLNIIVPRWAKSAAMLIACAADTISMTPVAELGPLDPQILDNPFADDGKRLSCLSIIETFQLIRSEFQYGDEHLAEGLLERLHFPLSLGRIIAAPKISKEYLARTLRMQKAERTPEEVNAIAEKLVYGYIDHGFCIHYDEARELGLPVRLLEGEMHDLVWKIHRLSVMKKDLSECE